ncbi:MAG TPA: nitroreductase/quinone reductase family protein [Trebonia sp.]
MADSAAASASLGQALVVAEFRANEGKVGGFRAGMALLLLTSIGAQTGQRRATPLAYLPDGDRYVVAAANGGADANPAWYHNVVANPRVTVEAGTETFGAIATIAAGAERVALYERCVAAYPQLADYQAMRAAREVPIVVITPYRD